MEEAEGFLPNAIALQDGKPAPMIKGIVCFAQVQKDLEEATGNRQQCLAAAGCILNLVSRIAVPVPLQAQKPCRAGSNSILESQVFRMLVVTWKVKVTSNNPISLIPGWFFGMRTRMQWDITNRSSPVV